MLHTNLRFTWPNGFRGEDNYLEINKSDTRISMTAMFVTDRDKISNLYRGPSIDASYQVVKARAVSKITIPTYKLDSNIPISSNE